MTVDGTTAHANSNSEQAPRRRIDRSWLGLFIGAAFVIGATYSFSAIMTRDDLDDPASTAFSPVVLDTFDRPASTTGLGTTDTTSWVDDAGTWGIEAGVGLVRVPSTTGLSITTSPMDTSNQSVNIKISGRGLCGVVLRYDDAQNYVALTRVAGFAVWNMTQVVDGKSEVVGKVADQDTNDVNVTFTATDNVMTASVGLNSQTIVAPVTPRGKRFGLLAEGPAPVNCGWDDVTALEAT